MIVINIDIVDMLVFAFIGMPVVCGTKVIIHELLNRDKKQKKQKKSARPVY